MSQINQPVTYKLQVYYAESEKNVKCGRYKAMQKYLVARNVFYLSFKKLLEFFRLNSSTSHLRFFPGTIRFTRFPVLRL